ncbi:hypothetical protein BH20ACT23_BH20ACT23_03830 [soil metagenome]
MKRLSWLLTACLILSWMIAGSAMAGDGPLKKTVDEVTKTVDKTVASSPVKKTVDEVTKTVDKTAASSPVKQTVDQVTKDVSTNTSPGGSTPELKPDGGSALANDVSGSESSKSRVSSAIVQSSNPPTGANRAKPSRDTEEVVAAGDMIEPAQVKGAQIIAPATEAEDSEGSGLPRTGFQFLTWLVLAGSLLGTGAASLKRGLPRVRLARS